MGKIVDFMKGIIDGITNKWIMFGFGVLLSALLVMLVSAMLSGSTVESIGNLLGIQDNKTKITLFIGWAIIGVLVAIGLVFLIWRTEFQVEYNKFIQQRYVRKPIDFIKDGITGKRIIFGFTTLLVVLLVALALIMFFNNTAEWIGNLLGTKNNKTETIQFIGWVMSGALAIIGFVVLNRKWAEFMKYMKYMKKIIKFMKEIIDVIIGKWIMFIFAVFLAALLVALFVVLVWVMLSGDMTESVKNILGIKDSKTKVIELIGWAMSGVSVAIGIVVLNRRAEAQVEDNRLVEEGHTQDRFKAATEHLGNEKASVRIAAFYEFVHLANDNKEKYQNSVLEILYAHIRITTTDSKYSNKASKSRKLETTSDEPKPTEEIQGLLDGLFKSKEICRDDIKPNLQRVYLSGVDLVKGDLSRTDLRKADLSRADLSGVDLSGADLSGANLFKAKLPTANLSTAKLWDANLSQAILHNADLSEAKLQGADLSKARLWDANLSEAKLQGADLSEAKLWDANLSGAKLFRVNLSKAELWNADLTKVKLQGADLSEAGLQGADLSEAELQDANLSEAELQNADLSGVRLFRANLSKAGLQGADLSEARLSEADLSGADLSGVNLSKARLGKAFYTNKTTFPKWLNPPSPPDDGGKVQFSERFIVPEKPEEPEDDE